MSLLLAFPGMEPLAGQIAEHWDVHAHSVDLHRFPDGETLVTLPEGMVDEDVAILATLHDPDPLALPLTFAAMTARELGARSVGLVAPYLAYMRQDRRFSPGQAVSAPIFARFLQRSFDWLVTADPHLHRVHSLGELFDFPTRRVATASLIAKWIVANVSDAVLLGPDSESAQWVGEVAKLANRPYEVLEKVRNGDHEVEVTVPRSKALLDGTPVILDDIASSGRTMIEAIERLAEAGCKPPVCVAIHAVFSGDAHDQILEAGAARIVTTDSIPHQSNAISLAGPLGLGSAELTAAIGK